MSGTRSVGNVLCRIKEQRALWEKLSNIYNGDQDKVNEALAVLGLTDRDITDLMFHLRATSDLFERQIEACNVEDKYY